MKTEVEIDAEKLAYIVYPDGTEDSIAMGSWIVRSGEYGAIEIEIGEDNTNIHNLHEIRFPKFDHVSRVYINTPMTSIVRVNRIIFEDDQSFDAITIFGKDLQHVHFPNEVNKILCPDIPDHHTIRLPHTLHDSLRCSYTAEFENIDVIHSSDFNGDIQMQEPIVER